MNKVNIDHLDLVLYQKTLDNGLEVYIVPKNISSNIFVTYTTKFGAIHTEFEINGEKITVPAGIAHFLEHKMFEQEDGIEPFKVFDQNGASANAYTNYHQTTYLFSGPDNFEKNLKMLIDYVTNPYFTDKNVEKEKGIITQELRMYQDAPYRKSIEGITKNCFNIHPIKEEVGGNIESVESITKEQLFTCYDAFYNPENMFLVVTGNVNPDDVIQLIEENNLQKLTDKKIVKTNYDEPDTVLKKSDRIKMNVTIPKVNYAIKINMEKYGLPKKQIRQYLSIFLDSNFGATSEFNERLKRNEIIDDDIGYTTINTEKHILIILGVDTKQEKKLIEEIKRTIKEKTDILTFERKKRAFISSIIYASDSIFNVNNMIVSSIINDNTFNPKLYDQLNSLNYLDYITLMEKIDFSNDTIFVIEPKQEKK